MPEESEKNLPRFHLNGSSGHYIYIYIYIKYIQTMYVCTCVNNYICRYMLLVFLYHLTHEIIYISYIVILYELLISRGP